MCRLPPSSTPFPYTTLFRSESAGTRGSADELIAAARDSRADVVLLDLTMHGRDRKSTRLNSSHRCISYAVFCLKKKTNNCDFTFISDCTAFLINIYKVFM